MSFSASGKKLKVSAPTWPRSAAISVWTSQRRELNAEFVCELTEARHVIAQEGELVGLALSRHEPLAIQTHEHGPRTDAETFWALVRALAGVLFREGDEVRRLQHDGLTFLPALPGGV